MRSLLCSALMALFLSSQAHAGRLMDISVVDRDTGRNLPTWTHDGKLYIAGKPGHRYSVRLGNRTGGRVLAVLSVDGVNAVSGETASANQSGYVLDAWESTEIKGWRKSLNEIAQFNFTSLPDSYAAQTGRPLNVGVIGVAVFTERSRRWIADEQIGQAPAAPDSRPWAKDSESSRAQSSSEPIAGAAKSRPAAPQAGAMEQRSDSMRERLGTGHGDREYAQVGTTQFERASSQPAETLSIWYDSYLNLAARGIIPRRPIASHEPNPFPNRFVPDPPRRW